MEVGFWGRTRLGWMDGVNLDCSSRGDDGGDYATIREKDRKEWRTLAHM